MRKAVEILSGDGRSERDAGEDFRVADSRAEMHMMIHTGSACRGLCPRVYFCEDI